MRTTFRIPTLALGALVLVACQPPAQEMAPARSMQEVDNDFEAMRGDWESLANADDASSVAAFYTEDAVFIDVYGSVYNGRAAIQGYFEESFPRSSGLTIQRSDLMAHGDMVAAAGTYSQTIQGPEGEMPMTGMWMTVSMYQPDGSVLIRMHQSMMPAEPPPEM